MTNSWRLRLASLGAAVCLAVAPLPALAQDPAVCAALAYIRADEGSGMYKAQWDESAFWKRLQGTSPSFGDLLARSTPAARTALLGRYLWVSEGGVDPFFTSATPMRTGYEVAMYQLIKQHVMSGGGLIGPEETMRFAMQAAAQGGAANVQLAMLTAHNVIRVLARPEQWAPGYDAQDPMKPIFEDLSGVPAVGGQSLRTYLKDKHGMGGNPKDANAIGYSLFESGGNVQIFRAMNGVGSTDQRGLANGGSHYYFWLGTIGQAIAGDLVAAGIKSEKDVKSAIGSASGSVGAIQARNAQVGRALARCLENGVVNNLPGGALPQAPGSTGGLFRGLGEVNKAIGECEIQDAVTAAKAVDAVYGQEPAWIDWYGKNMANLEAQARGEARAREAIKAGQDAILAKDLAGAIGHLDRAQYAQDVPACLVKKVLALKTELEVRLRFGELTKEVARDVNDLCDFQAASAVVGQIAALTPRETYMTDWMNENVPKIGALQQRERDANTQLALAQSAASTATSPAEWEAALLLLDKARGTAPQCVAQKMNLDGLKLDWENRKNPPIESSIVLLIDTSGSMSESDKIGQAKRAAEVAVRKASRSTEMAVLAFDGGCSAGSTRVVHDFSTDANSLMRAISSLAPGGGTPMYIATGVAVEHAKKFGRGKSRVVVLMSDGGDSCRGDMANAAAGIRTSQIPINTIGFDVGNNQQAQNDLSQLSGMTGGRSLGASAKDPREIIRAFDLAMLPSLLKSLDTGPGSSGATASGAGAVQGYFMQAKALVAQQDIGGAVFQFQQAQKLAPDSPAVHFNLSLLQEANDQLIPAMNHAREYLKLAPTALDRGDVENRITNLQDELRRNPREVADPTACRDIYNWAQVEQEQARKARDPERRQKMLEILIASQKGDCGKANTAADAYKRSYGGR